MAAHTVGRNGKCPFVLENDRIIGLKEQDVVFVAIALASDVRGEANVYFPSGCRDTALTILHLVSCVTVSV